MIKEKGRLVRKIVLGITLKLLLIGMLTLGLVLPIVTLPRHVLAGDDDTTVEPIYKKVGYPPEDAVVGVKISDPDGIRFVRVTVMKPHQYKNEIVYEEGWYPGIPGPVKYDGGPPLLHPEMWFRVAVADGQFPYQITHWKVDTAGNVIRLTRDNYKKMAGSANCCAHLAGSPPILWRFPYYTRAPYFTPGSLYQGMTFSHPDPTTGIVNITVHADSYVGLRHCFKDSDPGQTNLWYNVSMRVEVDGYGWLFTGDGSAPIYGDVDYYVFGNDTGTYWLSPSPMAGSLAALPGELPSPGPDGIPGTTDDGFGNGTADPPGSSVLYLPTRLKMEYWYESLGWMPLCETPFPMLMTTGTAYDIVIEPTKLIHGYNSTEEGEPWEFLAGLQDQGPVNWTHLDWNAFVTYACAWSMLEIETALGDLDIIYGVVEKLVREDCVIPDIDCDEEVNIYDIVKIGLAYGAKDEGFPDHPVADPNFDARADLKPERGLIDIYDLVTCAKDYGAKLTPNGIIRP